MQRQYKDIQWMHKSLLSYTELGGYIVSAYTIGMGYGHVIGYNYIGFSKLGINLCVYYMNCGN